MMRTDPITRPAPSRVECYDTIVVGAGQAGLAAGYHLANADADFLIVNTESRVGDSWRARWDSLRLFTPAAYSSLPGMVFPGEPLHLPDKDEVGDYLQRYAERFELPVRGNTRVERLQRDADLFVLTAGRVVFQANNVIVATGPFQRPRVPELAALLPRSIRQLHSSQYTNPFDLPSGPALVVGVGNSGAQIALELARSRKVWLAGRESGHLRRRVLGRDVYQWIWPLMTKFTADTMIGRKLRRAARRTDPLIGIDASTLRTAGIERVGKLTEVRDGLPYCDGVAVDPETVVWCTGFAPDYRWIDLPILGADGYPRHNRGIVPTEPGLYFLGQRFQHRMTSALIGGVGVDAGYVVDHILRNY